MKSFNFGIIGGGSIFSPELVYMIVENIDKFGTVNIKFMDTNKERQSIVGSFCERIIKKSQANINIEYVDTYEEAIKNCDYILIQFRVGGEDARIEDEFAGKKHKIPFVETISVCGVSTFLRTYYEIEKIARIIKEKSPNAWVLNFANPAGLITESLYKLGVKKVVGVCNASTRLLEFLKEKYKFDDNDEIYMNWRGLNHLTVVDKFNLNGKDIMPKILSELKDYESDRIPFSADMCRKLGYLPNQYFQYYYLERDAIEKEQKSEKTRAEIVKEINSDLLDLYKTIDYIPKELSERGGSGYSKTVIEVILSLHTNNKKIHYVITKNNGALTELPFDSFVEVPCVINKNRVTPLACEKLPSVANPLIYTMKLYEIKLTEGVMERDLDKIYNSMIINPLIRCDSVVKPLLEDILKINKEYIPRCFF